MNQLTLEDALRAGENSMEACAAKAMRNAPDFITKAEGAMLAHLAVVGECPGEALVDIVRAQGIRPHDDRAFGSVFRALSKRGLIRKAGYCDRVKGHGTSGGRIWCLAQPQ